jgi:hypothetical protein
MLKKLFLTVGCGVLGLAVLFTLANRPISDLIDYFRASASTTVKAIESEIPDVIHDERTEVEIAAVRRRLVDRQIQLNLSRNQVKDLEREIAVLTEAIDGRKRVLASAYPVLQEAMGDRQKQITFVSTKFTLHDFQHEIDNLLAVQKRDEYALRIKQQGYARLLGSVAEGEAALAEMKNRLLEIDQAFAMLKSRRDQARMDSETLDFVAHATTDQSFTTSEIGQVLNRLEGQVEKLEARNEARRVLASMDQRALNGKLTRPYNRLEALKRYSVVSIPE